MYYFFITDKPTPNPKHRPYTNIKSPRFVINELISTQNTTKKFPMAVVLYLFYSHGLYLLVKNEPNNKDMDVPTTCKGKIMLSSLNDIHSPFVCR